MIERAETYSVGTVEWRLFEEVKKLRAERQRIALVVATLDCYCEVGTGNCIRCQLCRAFDND